MSANRGVCTILEPIKLEHNTDSTDGTTTPCNPDCAASHLQPFCGMARKKRVASGSGASYLCMIASHDRQKYAAEILEIRALRPALRITLSYSSTLYLCKKSEIPINTAQLNHIIMSTLYSLKHALRERVLEVSRLLLSDTQYSDSFDILMKGLSKIYKEFITPQLS